MAASKKTKKKSSKKPNANSKQVLLIAFLCALLILGAIYIINPILFDEIISASAHTAQADLSQALSTPVPEDKQTTTPKLDVAAPSPTLNGEFTAYILDVGQGDSIFLTSPSGKTMLVDAGENDEFEAVDAFLKSKNVDKLDVVVATHPHTDHIGAMTKVINAYEIGAFYLSPKAHTTKTYEKMIDALEDKNIPTYPAYGGADALIQWDNEISVRILSPLKNEEYDDLNDYSVIMCCTFGNTGILLTGDAEAHAESLALSKLPLGLFNATAIKLGHHGSSSSSTEEFLKAISPEVALISLGADNKYGHPHKETLDLLAKLNIPYYRTDKSGTLTVIMDGKNTTVTTEK